MWSEGRARAPARERARSYKGEENEEESSVGQPEPWEGKVSWALGREGWGRKLLRLESLI